MLRLYSETEGAKSFLNNAYEVKVTHEINGDYSLSFNYPYDEKAEEISVNDLIICENQIFRIMRLSRENGMSLHAECLNIYNADAPRKHIQNIRFAGALPRTIIGEAFRDTEFSVATDEELSLYGLEWVDNDGFKIDFESADKTTPYDVMQQIIENCGRGELFIDGYKIALVKRLCTSERIVSLDLTHNLQNVSVERDISDTVTRLYPYGKDDLHIGSVNGGVQYIDSANASVYGIREGYKEYSEYSTPTDVMNHALWEFDSQNRDRIDIPAINVSGTLADLSKLAQNGNIYALNLGDEVCIFDGKEKIYERVIKIEYYPYEPMETAVSIGRVKKDMFFYLNQMGALAKKYGSISTSTGKVNAQAIAGQISLTSDISGVSSTGDLKISGDVFEIKNSGNIKCRIGNSGGGFVFDIYNKSSADKAVSLDSDGLKIYASAVKIGGCTVTADSGGNLLVNGKKIITEEASK